MYVFQGITVVEKITFIGKLMNVSIALYHIYHLYILERDVLVHIPQILPF